MPKYTAPQRELIRNVVHKAYLVGFKPNDILRLLAEKKVPLKKRQLESYLAEVKEEAKKSAKFDRDEELGKAKEKLEKLYRKCEASKDHRGALAVQREINELLGLIVQQHEHTGKMKFENWILGASERAAEKRREQAEKDALAAEEKEAAEKAAAEKKDGTDLKPEADSTPPAKPEPTPGEESEPESEEEPDGPETTGPED